MIGPSLEKHKGCDILDLNPGAGLWSQKLHEFLQPRSHILLEPSLDMYGEFLQPLVEKPNSTFQLVTGDPCRLNTYQDMFDNGLFPHQRRGLPHDISPREQNNSLLVTGSLMWDPKLPGLGFDSMSKQLLQHFTHMGWRNNIFHTFGSARMLLWMLRDDVRSALPESSHLMSRTSVLLNKVSNLVQVVAPELAPRSTAGNSSGREPRYTLQSLVRAMKVARANGQELPAHRRSVIHDFAEDVEQMSNGSGVLSIPQCSEYLKNQVLNGKSAVGLLSDSVIRSYLEQQATAKDPTRFYDYKAISESKHDIILTEEGVRATRRKSNTAHHGRLAATKDSIVDMGEAIYHLECEILGMKSQAEKKPALDSLRKLNEKFEASVARRSQNVRHQVFSDLDDRLILMSPVPRLRWDVRPFEPLVMRPDEIWPKGPACLLDIEPRPIPEGQSAESLEYFTDFVTGLLWRPAASLPEALETIQSAGSQLMEQVPRLRDPERGGRLDMNHLRVRMLTLEMIDELCKAYQEWPFRAPDANHSRYFRVRIGGS